MAGDQRLSGFGVHRGDVSGLFLQRLARVDAMSAQWQEGRPVDLTTVLVTINAVAGVLYAMRYPPRAMAAVIRAVIPVVQAWKELLRAWRE